MKKFLFVLQITRNKFSWIHSPVGNFSKCCIQVAFEDLKKEILVGQQEIAQGKVTSVADVRKEFGLD